jgi:putative oxidoreductase
MAHKKCWGGSAGLASQERWAFLRGSCTFPPRLPFWQIAAEFFGGLGLILGFLTRIAAFGIAVNMMVAIATVHSAFGFFMNWNGNLKGEGFEFHLLVLAMTVFLMIRGAGAFSIDHAIASTTPSRTTQPGLARS